MKAVGKGAKHCASCFGQHLDREYIDFDAAYDGPVVGGSIKMAIDDLVLCENCITQAAKLIGMDYADDLKKENQQLGEAVEHHKDRINDLERENRDLGASIGHYTQEKHKVPGRPKLIEA